MGETEASGVLLMERLDRERITAKMHTNDTAALLRFNISKQKIVDLCNVEFEEDVFDKAKVYSSWNRALNGKEVWQGITDAIDCLMTDQTAHPRSYLPHKGPPAEDLACWMKQIGGASWWREILNVSASQSAFNAWFSGRTMGKDKVAEVKAAVDVWWTKVMAACDRAEFASLGRELREASYNDRHAHGLASYFFTKIEEEGMSLDDARTLYLDLHDCAFQHYTSLIDLTNPVDPLTPMHGGHTEFLRNEYVADFDAMVASGFPNHIPKTAPAFDDEPWVEIKQWGDRRQEESPKDLNVALYGLWYKRECRRVWDAFERRIEVQYAIVEVSEDGQNWTAARDHHKRGWDAGTFFFCKHFDETGETPVNSYTRERQEIEVRIREIQNKVNSPATADTELSRLLAELSASHREIDALHL